MGFFKEIAKLIGWLSGSVAGIAAILYACGYLASQTFLHLLGIGGLVNYDYQTYLQRGANFLVDALGLALSVLLPLAAAIILSGMLGYLLCLGVKRLFGEMGFAVSLKQSLAGTHEEHPLLGWSVLYCLLLLLFFVLLFQNIELFEAPLSISGLLYDAGEMALATRDQPDLKEIIADWIVQENAEALRGHFATLILLELSAGFLLLLAWRVTDRLPFRNLLVSPFAIIFTLYISLLPMVYGPLMVKIELAPVSVSMAGETISDKPETYYLVTATGDEFTLWKPAEKRLVWLPKRELKIAEFMRKEFPIKLPAKAD